MQRLRNCLTKFFQLKAYYIIFLSFDNPLTPDDVDDSSTNPMATPIESIMAMFLMSLTNFGDYYNAFTRTEHEYVAKVLIIYIQRNFSVKIILKTISVSLCGLYGNRSNITHQHVDCHDG